MNGDIKETRIQKKNSKRERGTLGLLLQQRDKNQFNESKRYNKSSSVSQLSDLAAAAQATHQECRSHCEEGSH